MIIWSGRGILSVLLIFAFTVLFALISPMQYEVHGLAIGFVIGGWLTWYLGTRWNAEKLFYVEQENQMYRSKNTHTLFWIPMQYVGLIFIAIGVIVSLLDHILIGIALSVLAFVLVGYKALRERMAGNSATHQVTKETQAEEQPKESSPSWERRPETEDPNRFMPK
ncbi:hypothetical protein ACKUSY_14880 [Myroides odoratus]